MTDFVALVNTQYAKLGGAVTDNTSSSSSSADSSSTNTNTSTTTDTSSTQHTTTKPKKAVTYNHGGNNETATLTSNYTRWSVYNHVKGTSGAYKIGWGRLSSDHRGAKVYVDSRGHKSGGTNWYRIRFSKNSGYKYWVYSKTLNFPKVTYTDASGTVTLNTTQNAPLYNHVLNSKYLSKTTAYTQSFGAGTTGQVNKKGVKLTDGSIWYRVVINNKPYWAKSTSLTFN